MSAKCFETKDTPNSRLRELVRQLEQNGTTFLETNKIDSKFLLECKDTRKKQCILDKIILINKFSNKKIWAFFLSLMWEKAPIILHYVTKGIRDAFNTK